MGYETKLIVGQESGINESPKWFDIYAEINLCKCGYGSYIHALESSHKGEPLVYWYGYDGNERITEDRYGEKPLPLPLKDVLGALRKDAKHDSYRRFKWAIALLEEMDKEENFDKTVLLYGY